MASFQSLKCHFRRRLARLGFSRLPYPSLAICRCILMIETGQRAGLANRSPAASNCKTLRATKWRLSVGAGCPRAKTGFGCNKRHTKSGRARWGEKRLIWGRDGLGPACPPRPASAALPSTTDESHAFHPRTAPALYGLPSRPSTGLPSEAARPSAQLYCFVGDVLLMFC